MIFYLWNYVKAFDNYAEAQIPILKVEFPGLKRSQYMEMIQKNVRDIIL